MKRTEAVVAFLMLCAMGALAQEPTLGEQHSRQGFLRRVVAFMDSSTVKGVDRRYLAAPKRPWQVILQGNVNQSSLHLTATTPHADQIFSFMQGDMTWEPRVKTRPAAYAGFWAGYRGYGLGYSWNVAGDNGRILTTGITGGSYGVNLRIHWFESDTPEAYFSGNALHDITPQGEFVYTPLDYSETVELGSPISTRTLFLDAFYLFNGKRCSYAAAYNQSVLQRRSAGSLLAGAMYFHSTTRFDTDANADFILLMNDVGCIKSWQASVGIGYIYNWVPAKGLLVSAMAIPMVTFYNHHKMWRYDSNLKDLVLEEGFDAYEDFDESNYRIRPAANDAVVTSNSSAKLNIDARLSVTYEWANRYFVNAYGQFNRFRFDISESSGRLTDWYVNASMGVRF